MAALIGSLGAFDPSLETFTAYLERLEQFYVANYIGQCAADATEAVKKATDREKSRSYNFGYWRQNIQHLTRFLFPLSSKRKVLLRNL